MATPWLLSTENHFKKMPYIIILKVRKFHQPAASRFGIARQNPIGGGAQCAD